MVSVWGSEPQFARVLRLKLFDLYQQTWPRELVDLPVYIVDIDEKSLAEIGQWPWSRNVMAELVEKTFEAGTKSMAFDIVFAEPDRTSPSVISKNWNLNDEAKKSLAALPDNDDIFAKTVAKYPVVMGFTLLFNEDDVVEKDLIPAVGIGGRGNYADFIPHANGTVRNIGKLEENANSIGWFGYLPEVDNIIRRLPSLVTINIEEDGEVYQELFPPLALELLRLYQGKNNLTAISDEHGMKAIKAGEYELPTDADGYYWIRFRKGDRNNYISAADVLSGNVPEGMLKDSMVLVGTSAMGLLDMRTTPLDVSLPGVDVHAQIIENILTESFLHRPAWVLYAEFLYVLISAMCVLILVHYVGALWGWLIASSFAASVVGVSVWAFIQHGFLLDAVFPLLTISIMYLMQLVLKYAKEEASKKAIRSAFGHYLSKDLVNILTKDPTHLQLGGEEKEMTFLFSDIRGFTSLSEGLTPQQLTSFMNSYLTPMTDIVMSHQGTIDKYMGDAIMAFWNAPLDIQDHAIEACTSALAMMNALEELNSEWNANDLPSLDIGIGIHTGIASVGNMGSDQRFDYSVLGDSVNLASRLEGLCKLYGVNIILSEDTNRQAPDFNAILIDTVRVKGKSESVNIYSLSHSFVAMQEKDDIEAGIKFYRFQQWNEAEECFERVHAHLTLKSLYLQRIKEYKTNPPPLDWDGSYTATSK